MDNSVVNDIEVDMDGNGTLASHPQLIILDAGAQFAKVIDRRIRELNVHSEILPLSTSVEEITRTGCRLLFPFFFIVLEVPLSNTSMDMF